MDYNHEEYEKRAKRLLERSKGFLLILSTKDVIKIDGDQIRGVLGCIEKGKVIQARSAIINPSYIVSIVEDRKRNKEFEDEVRKVIAFNKFESEYGDEKNIKKLPEYRTLKDIFEVSLQKIETKNNQYLQRKN
jgi:hypothetical protein